MHLISPEELTSAIADRLARQSAVLVALDGRCGSGKTTLAAQLAERFPQWSNLQNTPLPAGSTAPQNSNTAPPPVCGAAGPAHRESR